MYIYRDNKLRPLSVFYIIIITYVSKKEIVHDVKWPNLLIITGMPVSYRAGLYNCMVALANGRICFIYAKSTLANDDIYRESRWFVPWQRRNEIVQFKINPVYGFEQVSRSMIGEVNINNYKSNYRFFVS